MRDILFRGKCPKWGHWHCGELINTGGKIAPYFPMILEIDDSGRIEAYDVDPETVGQFTGRIDRKGKRVFEGDILQLFYFWANGTIEPEKVPVIVKFDVHDQAYVLVTKEGHHCDDFGNHGHPGYYEVIGNVHDNPELLEGSE